MRRVVLALGIAAGLAGCGNKNVVTAADVARDYVSALAEGGFASACTMLAPDVRAGLESSSRSTCPTLLKRCLPEDSTILSRDQAQLLYVNTEPRVVERRTYVRLSGSAVARQIGEVTLINDRVGWRLTSPGKNIARCATALGRRRSGLAKGRRRPKH